MAIGFNWLTGVVSVVHQHTLESKEADTRGPSKTAVNPNPIPAQRGPEHSEQATVRTERERHSGRKALRETHSERDRETGVTVMVDDLREPMVNDFPAAVYTMILNKFSAAPVPPVEKARQAPTHRAVDTWGHDGGASPSRSPVHAPFLLAACSVPVNHLCLSASC